MTDYRDLSEWQKAKVDKMIIEEVEPGHKVNEHNGFEWDEPQYTLNSVHLGYTCAVCLMASHNCLCSHSD